jgi:hypothetical protein
MPAHPLAASPTLPSGQRGLPHTRQPPQKTERKAPIQNLKDCRKETRIAPVTAGGRHNAGIKRRRQEGERHIISPHAAPAPLHPPFQCG